MIKMDPEENNEDEATTTFNWSNHYKSLEAHLIQVLRSQELCDITVEVKNKEFRAHKIILSSGSSVLRRMILENPKAETLILEDEHPEIFQILLHFIYTGKLKYNPSSFVLRSKLLEASERLQILGANDLLLSLMKVKEEVHSDEGRDKRESEKRESLSEEVKIEDDDWFPSSEFILIPNLTLEEVEEENDDVDDDDLDDDEEDDMTLEKRKRGRPKGSLSKVKWENRGGLLVPIKSNDENLESEIVSDEKDYGNNKKYLCSLCGRTLAGLTAYNRHQVIHTGARPFSCDICGKSFTQNQRLTVHKRSHTGERPYLCSLCGKTFTESCKLKRHLTRVHRANKDGSALIPGQCVINLTNQAVDKKKKLQKKWVARNDGKKRLKKSRAATSARSTTEERANLTTNSSQSNFLPQFQPQQLQQPQLGNYNWLSSQQQQQQQQITQPK